MWLMVSLKGRRLMCLPVFPRASPLRKCIKYDCVLRLLMRACTCYVNRQQLLCIANLSLCIYYSLFYLPVFQERFTKQQDLRVKIFFTQKGFPSKEKVKNKGFDKCLFKMHLSVNHFWTNLWHSRCLHAITFQSVYWAFTGCSSPHKCLLQELTAP